MVTILAIIGGWVVFATVVNAIAEVFETDAIIVVLVGCGVLFGGLVLLYGAATLGQSMTVLGR